LFRPHGRILLVQRGSWFLLLGRYIHWLPRLKSSAGTRCGLCWNTDEDYRNRRKATGVVTSLTFRTLSRRAQRRRDQNEAYKAFFQQAPLPQEIAQFRYGTALDSRFVGDPDFVKDMAGRLGLPPPRAELGEAQLAEDIRRTAEAVLAGFRRKCQEALAPKEARRWKEQANLEALRSMRRMPPLPMLRALVTSSVVNQGVATLRQAERFLGCRPGTLASGRRQRYAERCLRLFNESPQGVRAEPTAAVQPQSLGSGTSSTPS
jgi:hypothetical protein